MGASKDDKSDKFRMFDEYELGKPNNWGCTIFIILLVGTINIGIVVGLRTLVELKDEFDESVLNTWQRELTYQVLGAFTLSFGFGCCCCFCCSCRCPGYMYKGSKLAARKYIEYRTEVEIREGLDIGYYQDKRHSKQSNRPLSVNTSSQKGAQYDSDISLYAPKVPSRSSTMQYLDPTNVVVVSSGRSGSSTSPSITCSAWSPHTQSSYAESNEGNEYHYANHLYASPLASNHSACNIDAKLNAAAVMRLGEMRTARLQQYGLFAPMQRTSSCPDISSLYSIPRIDEPATRVVKDRQMLYTAV